MRKHWNLYLLFSLTLFIFGSLTNFVGETSLIYELEWLLFLVYLQYTAFYVFLCKKINLKFFYPLLGLGLAIRLFSCFSNGFFEDDFYRYFVEGAMLNQGLDPFEVSPMEFGTQLDQDPQIENRVEVKQWVSLTGFSWMSGIYPPIVIQIFRYAGNFFTLNLFYLCLEVVILFLLLKKSYLTPIQGLLWWIHPLILMEAYINRHYDLLIALCLLLVLCLSNKNRTLIAGVFYGLAIHLKGYALIFLPFLSPLVGLYGSLSFLLFELLSYLSFPARYAADSSLQTFASAWEFNNGLYTGLRFLLIDKFGFSTSWIVILRFVFLCLLLLWLVSVWIQLGRNKRSALLACVGFYLLIPMNNPWYHLMSVPLFLLHSNEKEPVFFLACSLYYLLYLSHDAYFALFFTTPLSLLLLWYGFRNNRSNQ